MKETDRYVVCDDDGNQTLLDKVETWLINKIGLWITVDWWRYVLDDSRADKEYGPFITRYHVLPGIVPDFIAERFDFEYRWPFKVFGNYASRCWCRATQHRAGVWFYNPGAYEPDMHCKGCGEDLG